MRQQQYVLTNTLRYINSTLLSCIYPQHALFIIIPFALALDSRDQKELFFFFHNAQTILDFNAFVSQLISGADKAVKPSGAALLCPVGNSTETLLRSR